MGRYSVALAVLAGLLTLPLPAFGGEVTPENYLRAGPVLSGSEGVWAESAFKAGLGGDLEIRSGGADDPSRLVATLPTRPYDSQVPDALAASARRVAVIRYLANCRHDGCYYGARELLVGTPSGGFARLERTTEPEYDCMPIGADVDGDLVASTRLNCPEAPVVVRDMARGGMMQVIRSDDPYAVPSAAGPVKIAGRFVAWYARRMPGTDGPSGGPSPGKGAQGGVIVVYDRLANREAYRLAVSLPEDAPTNYHIPYDLQDDGTVVVLVPTFIWGGSPRVLWSSVADPAAHRMPVEASGEAVALHGGHVVLGRRVEEDFAAMDLNGSVRNAFAYAGFAPHYVDFDGRQVVWAQGDLGSESIHHETFPVAPSVQVPTGVIRVSKGVARVRVSCPNTGSRCKGSASLSRRTAGASPSSARTLGRRKFAIRGRRTGVVKIRLSRRGKRLVARKGSVRVRAAVVARSKGEKTRRRSANVKLRRR